MAYIRTQISLSESDRNVLDAVGRRTGRSMSALIRDAIHTTYGVPGSTDRVISALAETFGAVSVDASGEELVDAVRSGRRLADRG